MIQKMFSVYDCKAEFYDVPRCYNTTAEAMRAFGLAVNDESTTFCRFPADYTFFEIGTFDKSNGNIVLLEAKRNLGTGVDFKNKSSETIPMFPQKVGN